MFMNRAARGGRGRTRRRKCGRWRRRRRPEQWSIKPPIYLLVSAEEQKPFLSSASFFFCHSQWPTRLSLGDHLYSAVLCSTALNIAYNNSSALSPRSIQSGRGGIVNLPAWMDLVAFWGVRDEEANPVGQSFISALLCTALLCARFAAGCF